MAVRRHRLSSARRDGRPLPPGLRHDLGSDGRERRRRPRRRRDRSRRLRARERGDRRLRRDATARGTARASPASSPRIPTTASGRPASTGRRRSCRCACSANAAATIPTSSTASRGPRDCAVPGAPVNPTPAQVINLSLGGAGQLPADLSSGRSAPRYAHGVTRAIVAAAGNEAADVATDTPANCPGVISVASTTSRGNLARYSNFGAGITLSAPGGTFSRAFGVGIIIALSNIGHDDARRTIRSRTSGGTSFAAPMVSGTISLMLAVAPALTREPGACRSSRRRPSRFPPERLHDGALRRGHRRRGCRRARGRERVAARRRRITRACGGIRRPVPNPAGASTSRTRATSSSRRGSPTTRRARPGGWSMTANRTAPNVYRGTLYQTHGPAFNAVPFNPAGGDARRRSAPAR